jgi:hypothetical protein
VTALGEASADAPWVSFDDSEATDPMSGRLSTRRKQVLMPEKSLAALRKSLFTSAEVTFHASEVGYRSPEATRRPSEVTFRLAEGDER